MKKKLSSFTFLLVAAVWLLLTLLAWFGTKEEISLSERRPLSQSPSVSADTLLNGKFMEDFEEYTLDQFPLRDTFRSVKALFSRYVMGHKDNNGIYLHDGHIAEQCSPLDKNSVLHATGQFQLIYDLYLDESNRTFVSVVPDKGYYLAQPAGQLSMDYETLFETVESAMPWAQFVDITDCLTLADYYRTDTHWRQENLLPAAKKLGAALEVGVAEDYTQRALDFPFYGVYYGQAALPVQPETMYLMENPLLSDCRVYNYVTDSYTDIYDMEKLNGYDPYDVFLSGAQSLLRIENPNAATDRELILFRDSYCSSLAPLLTQDYAAITLIDIRYILPHLLGNYVDFAGKDVLFLYSSLVLNKNLI